MAEDYAKLVSGLQQILDVMDKLIVANDRRVDNSRRLTSSLPGGTSSEELTKLLDLQRHYTVRSLMAQAKLAALKSQLSDLSQG